MRLVYVTANFPFGRGEAYFEDELAELARQGWEILVVPRSTRGLANTRILQRGCHARPRRLISLEIVKKAAKQSAKAPMRTSAAVALLRRDPSHLFRNLAVVPKALWLADVAEEWAADHIHAHWAGTTATMAMIAAKLSGLTWSFTAHRWDIADANLIESKVRSASFVRAISKNGLDSLSKQVAELNRSKIEVVHMGVAIPGSLPPRHMYSSRSENVTIMCAGNLNEGKGHRYLLDAIAHLKIKGLNNIRLLIAGDGPLLGSLQSKTRSLDISEQVCFLGHLAHERLLSLYESGAVDLAVLPSSFEGIPVTLMEAMSYGIPVVATSVGGIPELCGEDCCVLIPPEDCEALAGAIETLLMDKVRMETVGARGRERVIEEFSSESAVGQLSSMMATAASPGRPT